MSMRRAEPPIGTVSYIALDFSRTISTMFAVKTRKHAITIVNVPCRYSRVPLSKLWLLKPWGLAMTKIHGVNNIPTSFVRIQVVVSNISIRTYLMAPYDTDTPS